MSMAVIAVAALVQAPVSVKAPVVSAAMFKNGFAVVFREIKVPKAGRYVLNAIPQSSMGTLWFSTSSGMQLKEVANVAAPTTGTFTYAQLNAIILGNVGKRMKLVYRVGTQELALAGVLVAANGDLAVLQSNGVQTAVPISQVVRVVGIDTLKTKFNQPLGGRALRFVTTGSPGSITMLSLERGLSWTPGYAFDLTDKKQLTITAKATVVNDLDSLKGISSRLVTGFPNMPFAEMLDPLVTGGPGAQTLAQAIGGAPGGLGGGRFANQAMARGGMAADFAPAMAAPQNEAGEQKEDLFFYPLPGLTLENGDRSYHVLFTYKADYQQIFAWDVENRSVTGNPEIDGRPQDVWNTAKFTNKSGRPLTTGPATVFDGDDIIGQNQLDYTPNGAEGEIKINKALAIKAEAVEEEIGRERGAIKYDNGNPMYDRITMRGTLSATCFRNAESTVRIRKTFTGDLTAADNSPKVVKTAAGLRDVNPVTNLEWSLVLAPGQNQKITYTYTILMRS